MAAATATNALQSLTNAGVTNNLLSAINSVTNAPAGLASPSQTVPIGTLSQVWHWAEAHPEFSLAILAALSGIITWFSCRYNLRAWSCVRWNLIDALFKIRCTWKPCRARIVTIGDYVFLLEKLRSAIIEHYEHNKKTTPKIVIHVFTMQLPGEWPLWDSEIKADDQGKTDLENYYFNFRMFLNAGHHNGYNVEVKRVIVIDSCLSPSGIKRFEQLKSEVSSNFFDSYIKTLHNSEADAFFYKTKRPWPRWLTDAVFYGIEVDNKRRWLWAVTTSFNTDEDLILLRHHRLTMRGVPKHLPLPSGLNNLSELADKAGEISWDMKPLSELRAAGTAGQSQATTNVSSSAPLPSPKAAVKPNKKNP